MRAVRNHNNTAMHAAPLPTHYPLQSSPRLSLAGVIAVAAAHAGLITLLLSFKVVTIPPQLATLMVEIITPSAPTVSVAPPRPNAADHKPAARPKPMPKPPAERQRLAAPAAATSAVASVPAPADAPPAAAAAAAANVAAGTAATAGASTDAAASTTQPRFDANYLQNPAPTYPPLSRRLGEQGRVVLRVLVDHNGHPTQVEVKTSSGSARLDQSAQDAVGRWQFVPARRGDEAVDAWVLVPIVFNLRS